ncbi:MAG: DUF4406 domain-containing protein [Treponema sp.]|nr:DUF4406 domain-containing protein [Treponema sp.]
MIFYISGPITGMPDGNKKDFQTAQKAIKWLFKKNHPELKVINPQKIGAKVDRQFKNSGKTPEWEDYMRACVRELATATFVFLLPGWQNSRGAVMEKNMAEMLKIPYATNMDEILQLVIERK